METTDAAGNSYSEVMSITIDNELDANQTVPGAQFILEGQTLTFNTANGNAVSVSDSFGGRTHRCRSRYRQTRHPDTVRKQRG